MKLNGNPPIMKAMNFYMCKLTPMESKKSSIETLCIMEMLLPGNADRLHLL